MMYDLLYDFLQRPMPFSRYTTKELWTRPHLARQMLHFHLNQETELASRPFESIDRVVNWIDTQINLRKKQVCDLGCGPGLYTQRFSDKEAIVTGVDFSAHSLEYANKQTPQEIQYIHADYLIDELPSGFDLVTLIYCDICALSPEQRKILLKRMASMLNPGGQIIIDVAAIHAFSRKKESTSIENNMMEGFWAANDYVGLQRSFVYPEANLSLDRYLIVEAAETWQIFNWFQYFTAEAIKAELNVAGFEITQMAGDLSGEPLTVESNTIGIIAQRSSDK